MRFGVDVLMIPRYPDMGYGVDRLRYYTDMVIPAMPKRFCTLEVRDFIVKEFQERNWDESVVSTRTSHTNMAEINRTLMRLKALVRPVDGTGSTLGVNVVFSKVNGEG